MEVIENKITQTQYQLSSVGFTITAISSLTLGLSSLALNVGTFPVIAAAIISIGLPLLPVTLIVSGTFMALTAFFIALAIHNMIKAEVQVYNTAVKVHRIVPGQLLEISTNLKKIIQNYENGEKIKHTVRVIKDDLPFAVVVKNCSDFDDQKFNTSKSSNFRFRANGDATELINTLDLTHLVVPKSTIYRYFLIEEKLPLPPTDIKYQLGLYRNDPELFSQAIEDFTRFLCHCKLKDIVGNLKRPIYTDIFQLPSMMPRFDNVPLYIEDGVGKIGLIDLERFTLLEDGEPTKKSCERALKQALTFFPDHEELIRATCNEIFEGSGNKELKERLTNRQLFEENIYQNHMNFIETHEKILDFTNEEINHLQTALDPNILASLDTLKEEWNKQIEKNINNNQSFANEQFAAPFLRTFAYKNSDADMIALLKALVTMEKIFLFEPVPGKEGEYLVFA